MNCADVDKWLDDFVDGALDSDHLRTAVADHLDVCPSCGEARDRLMALRRTAAALPDALPPDRDLWPGVAARIGAPRRAANLAWPVRIAAAAAFMVLGGLLTFTVMRTDIGLSGPSVRHEGTVLARREVPLPSAQGGILPARLDLRSMPSGTRSVMIGNLVTLQQALARLQDAMARHPDDTALQTLYINTYQQQMALIGRIERMAGTHQLQRRTVL
ncbi:MAG: zf-HC2 domain-containing protein [Gammaproteobacteria bacterium]|jgi:hypothetical protein